MYPQIALWSWTAATQRLDLNTSWLELLGPALGLRELVAERDRAAVERAWGRLAGGESDAADVSLRLASRRGAGVRVRIVAFVTERAADGAPSALRGTIEHQQEHDSSPESAAAVTRAVPGALTDSLTGLPNRAAFIEALERAAAHYRTDSGAAFAVLFLDFDRFKLVNDTMGHAAGDELLRHIASRLQMSVRQTDRGASGEAPGIAARFGGDEFAVLLTDLRCEAAVGLIADRLLRVLSQPYEIQGRMIHSSASIGIVSSGHGLQDASEIIQCADVAMYEAKHSGRARAVIFDEAMQNRLTRRLMLESDLREALQSERLTVVYQPIVDLDSGNMISAEALVRWIHPSLGAVSPAEFIPIAEESGLIVPLGNFVLREACAQFQAWRKAAPAAAPGSISVNLSRTELGLGDGYVRRLREVMAATGIAPGCLQLEVTEREIVRDPKLSLQLMHSLKEIGVRLAMDDFGTGASSLSCLRDFPFDAIKIDQSFLGNVESQRDVLMVLNATVSLIENLGMLSVAEGVERPSQLAALQSLGCRQAQGYLFSRPVSGDALTGVDCHAFRRTDPAVA